MARLCLPEQYRGYVLQQYHDDILGALRGTVKLFAAIRQHYFWPKMQGDISKYMQTCQACLTGKHGTSAKRPWNYAMFTRFGIICTWMLCLFPKTLPMDSQNVWS